MVIDSSALIAVLENEPTAPQIAEVMDSAPVILLSAANLVEASIVIERRNGDSGGRELDLLIYRTAIEVIAVDQDQAEIARMA